MKISKDMIKRNRGNCEECIYHGSEEEVGCDPKGMCRFMSPQMFDEAMSDSSLEEEYYDDNYI